MRALTQIEYAGKAVENAGTALAVRTRHGVVFAVENLVHSKLLVRGSNKRIFHVDRHIGLTSAGLTADGKHLAGRARDEATNFFDTYRQKTPVKTLAERVALYVQAFTLYSSVRPFGVAAIIGGVDEARGPQLYVVEPSGMVLGYHGAAIGKGRQFAKTEIEKVAWDELSMEQAVEEAARMYVARLTQHLQGARRQQGQGVRARALVGRRGRAPRARAQRAARRGDPQGGAGARGGHGGLVYEAELRRRGCRGLREPHDAVQHKCMAHQHALHRADQQCIEPP